MIPYTYSGDMRQKLTPPAPVERQSEDFLLHMTPTLKRRVHQCARKNNVSMTQVILQLLTGALDLLDRQDAEAKTTE